MVLQRLAVVRADGDFSGPPLRGPPDAAAQAEEHGRGFCRAPTITYMSGVARVRRFPWRRPRQDGVGSGRTRASLRLFLLGLRGVGVGHFSHLLEHGVALRIGFGQFGAQLFGGFGVFLLQRGVAGFTAQEFLNVRAGGLAIQQEGVLLSLASSGLWRYRGQ